MIYFVGNVEKDICKIGYSARPHRRIKSIQSTLDYVLSIFDIVDGTMADEKIIHALNDSARITGEWYTLSKVKSLDLKGQIETIIVGEVNLVRNKDGYYHATSLINSIDQFKIRNNRNRLNFTQWMRVNEPFISSFIEKEITPIKKGYAYWLHPFIAIEIMRADPSTKLMAYENLDLIMGDSKEDLMNPKESIMIGVKENVK